jgi:hypothetical protein
MGYGVKVTDGSACHVRVEIRDWVIALARSEITIFQTLVARDTLVFFNMGFNDDDGDDFLRQFLPATPVFKADSRASENKDTCFKETTTKL